MPTTTAMSIKTRAADGKNTITAVGTTCRTPHRHSLSTPSSRRGSGVMSAPLPPLGVREAGAVASAASIVAREALGTLAVVVASAVSIVVGTVGTSVVSVAEEVGAVVALADLVVVSAASAAEVSGARSTDKLDEEKVSPQRRRGHQGGRNKNGFLQEVTEITEIIKNFVSLLMTEC